MFVKSNKVAIHATHGSACVKILEISQKTTTMLLGSLHLLHMVKELPCESSVTVQFPSLSDDDRCCAFFLFAATSRTFDDFLA
jgi:hypothetical protein